MDRYDLKSGCDFPSKLHECPSQYPWTKVSFGEMKEQVPPEHVAPLHSSNVQAPPYNNGDNSKNQRIISFMQ